MSDDKIAEIRARHLRDDRWRYSPSMMAPQMHDDRATLLDEVDRQRAEIERLREALQESACACSSIRECASEWAKDGKCPHLIARVALEGKP